MHRCRADRRAAATSATPCAPARSAARGAVARSQPPASASSGAPQQPLHPRPPSTPSSHGTHAPSATSATGRSPRIGGLCPQGIMDPRAGRKGGPCTPLLIGSSSSFSLVSLKSGSLPVKLIHLVGLYHINIYITFRSQQSSWLRTSAILFNSKPAYEIIAKYST